jgi:hypothetical protein
MSHYALVVDGIVTDVIVAEQDHINLIQETSIGQWIQTSYNTRANLHYAPDSDTPDGQPPLRGNYAAIGYKYDSTHDVFYPPQPYPSWTLNQSIWNWAPPTTNPVDGKEYKWDESTKTWILIKPS